MVYHLEGLYFLAEICTRDQQAYDEAPINMSYGNVSRWMREIPRPFNTQEMCDKAVRIEPRSFSFIPNRFKLDGLCIKAARKNAYALDCMSDNLKMQKNM